MSDPPIQCDDGVEYITDGRVYVVTLRIKGVEHMLAPEHAEYLGHALLRVAQQTKAERQCQRARRSEKLIPEVPSSDPTMISRLK